MRPTSMKSEHLRLAAALLFGALGFATALSSGGHDGRVLASAVLWLLALVALGLPWRVLLGLAAALALASVVFAALDRTDVARRTLFGSVGVALEAALLYVASNVN